MILDKLAADVHDMFVSATAPSLSDRFALVIDGLCRLVAARGAQQRASGALVVLIWTRLRRIAARFARLAATDPGATIATAPRRPNPPGPLPPMPRPAKPRLPRGFAWLVRAVPEAACFGEQLRHLLADPEMAALLATPRMARLLDPLCRMLAVELPEAAQPETPRPAARPAPRPRSTWPPAAWSAPAPIGLAQIAQRLFSPG